MADSSDSLARVLLGVEFDDVVPRAEAGEPWAMRRAAELCDLFDRDAEALVWWRRAAAAGEPDAIMYLTEERR